MNYAKSLFPVLHDIPFKVGYTDDESDFVYARSDMELKEAYRLFKTSNEIRLVIHESDQPLNTSGLKGEHSHNSSPMPKQPIVSAPSDNSSPISEDEKGLNIDDSHLQLSLVHLKQLMDDLSKAKENLIVFNDKNRAKLIDNEKLISAERERFNNLELELKLAQETYLSSGQELSNLKESLKNVGTQLHGKLKEISDLKKDREDKLRLKSQLDEIDKQLNGKIEENLTMSKNLYTLTIERDHFNKKAKDLEHRQKSMEFELTASKFVNMGTSSPPPVSNDNPAPIKPVIPAPGAKNNQPIPVNRPDHPILKPHTIVPSSVIHPHGTVTQPLPVNRPDHPILKPHTIVPSSVIHPQGTVTQPLPVISKPVYDLENPPPDIDIEDIKMLSSMGFNLTPENLFEIIRMHDGDISIVIEELLNNIKMKTQ